VQSADLRDTTRSVSRGHGQGGAPPPQGEVDSLASVRRAMVEDQIAARGVTDRRVLAAMAEVPRHRFVDGQLQGMAYEDRPLPIGFHQTISQPFMVARATELAAPAPGDRALEIGAGCGYQAAVLSRLCQQVFAVEIVPELASRASLVLRTLGYDNVTVGSFDGSGGWSAHAPYDVIVVSAGAPRIPTLLLDQLADGGRLVVPVGGFDTQVLTRVLRHGSQYDIVEDTRCRYVDLVGRYGVGAIVPQA
jgi:protein-L-isoaspartate(D-aspartate) O-methyltransferase